MSAETKPGMVGFGRSWVLGEDDASPVAVAEVSATATMGYLSAWPEPVRLPPQMLLRVAHACLDAYATIRRTEMHGLDYRVLAAYHLLDDATEDFYEDDDGGWHKERL